MQACLADCVSWSTSSPGPSVQKHHVRQRAALWESRGSAALPRPSVGPHIDAPTDTIPSFKRIHFMHPTPQRVSHKRDAASRVVDGLPWGSDDGDLSDSESAQVPTSLCYYLCRRLHGRCSTLNLCALLLSAITAAWRVIYAWFVRTSHV